jgi:hypothetical protein
MLYRSLAMTFSIVPRGACYWCNLSDDCVHLTPEIGSVTLQYTELIEIIRFVKVRGLQGEISLSLRHIAEYLMA